LSFFCVQVWEALTQSLVGHGGPGASFGYGRDVKKAMAIRHTCWSSREYLRRGGNMVSNLDIKSSIQNLVNKLSQTLSLYSNGEQYSRTMATLYSF